MCLICSTWWPTWFTWPGVSHVALEAPLARRGTKLPWDWVIFFGGQKNLWKGRPIASAMWDYWRVSPFQKVIYFEAHTCITTGYFIQLASWVLTLQLRHSQHNYMKMCVSLLHHRWSMCLNISIPCLTFTHWIPGVGAIYLTEKLLTNRLANR